MDDHDNRSSTTATEAIQNGNDTLSPTHGTVEEMLNRYTHCVICGGNLHFTHMTDFSRNLTQETARCPECGVKARQVMHRLQ